MKIVHIYLGSLNINSSSGVINVIHNLSSHQAKKNDVIIYCLTNKITNAAKTNYKVYEFPVSKNKFKISKEMKKSILFEQPDIVHFHSIYIPQFITLGSFLHKNGIPYIISSHGALALESYNKNSIIKKAFNFMYQKKFFSRAKAIIIYDAESNGLDFVRMKSKIIKAVNGVNIEKTEIKKDFVDKRSILYLGRDDIYYKGLDLLFQSFERVNMNAELIIAGPFEDNIKDNLLKMVEKNKNSIKFIGPVYKKDKKDAFLNADFFVHTSRSEGMPISVLEACSYGKPVIVTPAASLNDMIQKYDAGLVAELSVEDIAEKIKIAVNMKPKEIIRKSKNAKHMIRKEFQWKDISDQSIKIYEQAIHENR